MTVARRILLGCLMMVTQGVLGYGCASSDARIEGDSRTEADDAVEDDGTDGPSDVTDDGMDGADVEPACTCSPGLHNDRIFVLSDDGELYNYDPVTNEFEFVVGPVCGGTLEPYSMAVDPDGVAWMLSSVSRRVMTIDVNDPGTCEDSDYNPTPGFGLFGMAFTAESASSICPRLYALTYSGSGAFSEGDDVGTLATMDPDTMELVEVGSIDFDGGELAGTRDGRLFAFAGVDPAKLIQYDRTDASEIERIPLDGLSQTHASAFAFFGGDFYIFTEARGADCIPCLEDTCLASYEDCMADAFCTEQFNCALDNHDITDECGGFMPGDLIDCLFGDCIDECFIPAVNRVSRVTRMDYDGSDGPPGNLLEVNSQAPIRIVGAGTSPCVPEIPW